ncbi:MAG: hypothetical protein ACREOG_23960, partial [Gemmatimonadaceae bacterium]
GAYNIKAQTLPVTKIVTACVIARARITVGTQQKETLVSGGTIQFVEPSARPDTATIHIVLPP